MFLKPAPPPYDPLDWETKPHREQNRMACAAWALQGYGAPFGVYLVHGLKLLLYVSGWLAFCSFKPGLGSIANIGSWWLEAESFRTAILWSLLFELAGLGCGSGPLTGRYFPPIGGALYFLRPNTLKLPLFPGVLVIGAASRAWLDVALYAATCVLLLVALVAPAMRPAHAAAIAALVLALGVLDKTLFLCARGEHYWTTLMVFVLAPDFVPGAKGVQAALWFWAGVSKLNHHFPAVVATMISNSPVIRWRRVRRLMYRRYPEDLAPSRLATWMGHGGTLLELGVPLLLLAGDGGTLTRVGLVLMLMLHGFITSNVPMGVPLEWNVMMVYGGFFLFWKHAGVSVLDASAPVAGLLGVMCVAVPLLGNLLPAHIPFLLAMRYYAGNWAYSVWFFRKGSEQKLSLLTKSSAWVPAQLARFYDRSTCLAILGRARAFRLMHLHGRALRQLVPKAIPEPSEYEWMDGELVAGMALGWNFGDGHLHREQLLHGIQERCAFEEGELRCVMVEAQPLGRSTLHYRIVDAKTGPLEQGHLDIKALRARPP